MKIPGIITAVDEDSYAEISARYRKHPVDLLTVSLHNNFRRITLVNRNLTERCTIDTELSFANEHGRTADACGMAIIEVKQSKSSVHSAMVRALKAARIYPCSVSKYAYGMLLTNPDLKHNSFKQLLHYIDKTIPAPAQIFTT